ncbi:LppX_LprAFG lipoprotein [Amycolatopsis sp. cg5]|uniref:LppX_LprAFG lipoprotein n=1 Tax=Amycolatopsis sp. cg5 TaxID=3238802 RepID=UPI003524A459
MLRRTFGPVFVLVACLISGCTATFDTSGPLPDGTRLVTESAATLRGQRAVRFALGVSGEIPGFGVRKIDGEVAADGSARGHADLQVSSQRQQLDYVLSGEKLQTTDQAGVRTEMPATYRPDMVVARLRALLTSATDLRTEGRENPGGTLAYRIGGKIPRATISALIPGIQADVIAKIWVADTPSHELTRMWVQVPEVAAHRGPVMLELGLTWR